MSPWLVLLMFVGPAVLVGVILVVVFALVAVRQRAKAEKIVADEGVVMRSGWVKVRTAYDNYVSPRLRSKWRRASNGGELVLTPQALSVVIIRGFRFTDDDLKKVSAKVEDGELVLATDRPPNATGKLRIAARVPDPQGWLDALRRRGARAEA